MDDPLDRLYSAARKASGYLDLGMKEQAIRELSTVLNDDDYIDKLYEDDLTKSYFEQYEDGPNG